MTNEVVIQQFDLDFVTVKGTAPVTVIATANRFNGYRWNAVDLLNDEIKYARWFDKSGTYKVRYIYLRGVNGGIIDLGLDSPSGNNLFDGIDHFNASTVENNVKETTIEISRGFHDISIFNEADGDTSDFRYQFNAIQFDLIDEHPVLGESAPAKEADGMVLLGRYIARKAEGTKTFDLADIIENGKYSEIIVKITGRATLAFALQMQLNGVTSTTYDLEQLKVIGATVTGVSLGVQTSVELASTSLINTANRRFATEVSIRHSLTQTRFDGLYKSVGNTVGFETGAFGTSFSSVGKLTGITIKTSTSTWLVNTKIEVYGVKK